MDRRNLSAWIAVTYDIISKLRELAAGNDPNAKKFVEDLDNAAVQHNIPHLQRKCRHLNGDLFCFKSVIPGE